MRGTAKRKFAEVEDNPIFSSSSSSSSPSSSLPSPASLEWESDGEGSLDLTPHSPPSPTSLPVRSILKRPKLTGTRSSVSFDQVTVFSFPRCQGFTTVPRRGGATLGMTRRHSGLQRYTLTQHALEQRHRWTQRLRERLRGEKLEALKLKMITSGAIDQREADRLTVDLIPDNDADIQVSDGDVEDGCFLQPYSSRQRQAVLLASGVKRIDREEKRQLHSLRLSREACGCDCQGFCEPETCACSLAGIKCQVDRFNFPCGCSKDGCGNTRGRIQFNSKRVQTHYIHTSMRLELEQRLQDETPSPEHQTGLPEDLQEYAEDPDETRSVQNSLDKSCPFGFSAEEEGLPLTMPTVPSFPFIPERLMMEENSCSSDMTESSCTSSDSEAGLSGSHNLTEVDGGLSRALNIFDSEGNNHSEGGQLRHTGESQMQHSKHCATYSTPTDSTGANTFTDNMSRTSLTGFMDENANQAVDLFGDDDSLEGFPNTPSPTVDYSSGRYVDLSLSSDSDLEFFDTDYCASGPLHSSFKLHPDGLQHLHLLSCSSLPQYESSTYLLESLIGLTEPGPEQAYAVDGQLL